MAARAGPLNLAEQGLGPRSMEWLLQSDGKIVIGGPFTTALGSYQLQANPTLTATFTNFTATLSINAGDISITVSPGGGAHFFQA